MIWSLHYKNAMDKVQREERKYIFLVLNYVYNFWVKAEILFLNEQSLKLLALPCEISFNVVSVLFLGKQLPKWRTIYMKLV